MVRAKSKLPGCVLGIGIVAVLVLAIGGYLAACALKAAQLAAHLDRTAFWVSDYVREHNGDWPRSWQDLHDVSKPPFEDATRSTRSFQKTVEIDFTADPAALAAQEPAELNAIRPIVPNWCLPPEGDYRNDHGFQVLFETLREFHPPEP